ncbi:MAG: DUF433 domain-containing protein [Cyanobium sp. 49614_E6]|nr:DUF433 domain-containing protein [Cyanobium sp. 49614_E6]
MSILHDGHLTVRHKQNHTIRCAHLRRRTGSTTYDGLMGFIRISHDPAVMGGKPCIRGLRITVGTVVGLIASGNSRERILQAYPQLEAADIDEALAYAAWRLEEREEALVLS